MKRSLVAGLGLLALAALPASAADLPRGCNAVQGAGLCRAVQLDRVLSGHQRRRRLGRLRLERFRRQQQPVWRHDRRHRRLQLAGRRAARGCSASKATSTGPTSRTASACGGLICETRNNWFGTVRGRVGYAFDRFLPYFTGGLAFGDVEANRTGFAGSKDTNAGWTVGVGIEGVIAGNWTAKVEYLYADLGDTTCSAVACGTATNVDLQLNILRGGLNYRF